MKFAIFPNMEKSVFYKLFPQLADIFNELGIEYYLLDKYKKKAEEHNLFIEDKHYKSLEWITSHVSYVMSIGGDGAYLAVACTMADYPVAQVGLHMGDFGFLNLISEKNLKERMIQITQDDYILEKRFFLESYLIHQDGTKKMLPIALNDVVVGHSAIGKMVRLHLHIDKQFIQTYAADGIIISSPTGSTGYAMSCGGPVLPSDSKDFLVIPVCVHTGLTSPLIIPNNAEVKITLPEREKNVHISLDVTYTFQMAPTDQLIIKNCLKQIRFIRFKDQGFFKILTKKFENYEKKE